MEEKNREGVIMPEDKKKTRGTAVAKLDIQVPQVRLNEETVRRLICKNATKSEILLFLNQCKMWGLNPFKKEIYLIKYQEGEPAATVIGYETFLKRAERQKKLKGWRVWTEGNIKDASNFKACIKIIREDWDEPFIHEVYLEEYARRKRSGELTRFWAQQPRTQLKKVAMSQGFRLCFPDELGGLPYIVEEMPIDAEIIPGEIIEEPKVVEEEKTDEEKEKLKVKKPPAEEPKTDQPPQEPEVKEPETHEPKEKTPKELTKEERAAKQKETITDIEEKLKAKTIDPKSFRGFLGEEFQPRKKKEEDKDFNFVSKDEKGEWSFLEGTLEDLELAKLHLNFLVAEYINWDTHKKEEETKKEEEKKKEEEDLPF